MPSVSIIVPVYNVEKYLPLCLDSLQAQTLQDIEIILIDDGSTDSCGAICDKYAASDNRFKVYHTENRGLSAARNLGIQNANSDYLMFVDSDDWVNPLFCEIPYTVAKENNADMVIFQTEETTENGRIKKHNRRKKPIGPISWETAVKYCHATVWDKIYRKGLFTDIHYPEGHLFEDVAVTYKLIHESNGIVMLSDSLLFHRIRKNGISRTKNNPARKDYFTYCIQRYKDLVQYGYPEEKARNRLQSNAITYCYFMPCSEDELYQYAERLLTEVKGLPKGWGKKKTALFMIWKTNKHLFQCVRRLV